MSKHKTLSQSPGLSFLLMVLALWFAVGCDARSSDPFLTKKINNLSGVISVCYPDQESGRPSKVADLEARVSVRLTEGRLNDESAKIVREIQKEYDIVIEQEKIGAEATTSVYIVKKSGGQKLFVISLKGAS